MTDEDGWACYNDPAELDELAEELANDHDVDWAGASIPIRNYWRQRAVEWAAADELSQLGQEMGPDR